MMPDKFPNAPAEAQTAGRDLFGSLNASITFGLLS